MTLPDLTLSANLAVPDAARGLVVFAHGTGSDRHSRRNNHVARVFGDHGLATLVLDLLSAEEQNAAAAGLAGPDVRAQGDRVAMVCDWVRAGERIAPLPIGLFGASTGAAAVLFAAAARPHDVAAVVSRGGRVDLVGDALAEVRCPVQLVVGELDRVVAEANHAAAPRFGGGAQVVEIGGATHLFAEPGTLDQVAERASDWFERHLGAG
ncbi:alpha/beta hydrolase [bacterium]|nr:alpha/beta hydrolase [bacterium]